VRAFYAEANPNWALDGPKAWLAAQLLWEPNRDPDQLLDLYYREFWAEAEVPMREFFAVAERTWLEQPGPALWLRYFQDEDQCYIYPLERRQQLRAQLDRAAEIASSGLVRARVAFVGAGFSVCEAFWKFCAAREHASRLARRGVDPITLIAAWREYRHARDQFVARFNRVRMEEPLAIGAQDLAIYLRHEPDSRIARELVRTEPGRAALADAPYLATEDIGATSRRIALVESDGVECLQDANWARVSTLPVGSSATIEWTRPGGPWRGSGEPWEGRTVKLGANLLRLSGCRTEGIGQWSPASPGDLYAARVKVRAKTSPGTATFLIVTFLDEKNRHIGIGCVDRLPPDSAVQETELYVVVAAPANARFIGFGVRVLNQINDDFAEFSEASLKRLGRQ
jgi:hypothetical protein